MSTFTEPKRTRCQDWLLNILAENGAVKPADVVELGCQQGFSRATIYRVRQGLGDRIENTDGYMSPFNRWKLAA